VTAGPITVVTAPEPSTWAMMLPGFLGLLRQLSRLAKDSSGSLAAGRRKALANLMITSE
jgi:hypothetical protein